MMETCYITDHSHILARDVVNFWDAIRCNTILKFYESGLTQTY